MVLYGLMYNPYMTNSITIPNELVELIGRLTLENFYKNKALVEIEKKLEEIEKKNEVSTEIK